MLEGTATIRGRLVTLRPLSRDDYATLFRWRSSLETVHLLNFRRKITTYEEFVGELEPLLRASILLLIREDRGGAPIGYALAHSITPWDGWLMVGIYVEEDYRLKGHGGEAALLCVDALFRWFPLRRVFTEIYDFAGPIVRLVEAMGFEEVGRLPEHYWHQDRFWDLHTMMLTREGWERRREHFDAILAVQQQYDELARARGDGADGR